MKKILLLLTSMFFLVACSSQVDKLDGSWQCDAVATIEINNSPQYKKAMQNEAAKKLLVAMLEASRMEIDTKNKQINMHFGNMGQKQSFVILSEDGDTINLNMEGEKGSFTVIDNNTLHVKNSSGQNEVVTLVFKKTKQ